MTNVRQTIAILRKDLSVMWQVRSRQVSVFVFGTTVLLLFSFAAGPNAEHLAEQSSGYFWLALLFASIMGLSESFRVENEDDALTTLVLLPVDYWAFFWGKALANFVSLLALSAVILPACIVVFDVEVKGSVPMLFLLVGLGLGGLAAPGTLYAAMTSQVRGRDVMFPLLLFPLIVPVLVAAVKGTSLVFGGDPMGQMWDWVQLLTVFNVVYWLLCPLLMGRILDD